MTKATVAQSETADSVEAGRELGTKVVEALRGERPDALLVFACPTYDFTALLRSIDATCRPKAMMGGAAVGGFSGPSYSERSACVVALHSPDMRFSVASGRGLRASREEVTRELLSTFTGLGDHSFVYRSAIVLIDARAANAERFVDDLIARTGGTYQFFGGGIADDFQIRNAHLFSGTEVISDAAVALEILSNKPLGVGVCHGWHPIGPRMRVTQVEGRHLVSLNSISAREVFAEHAETVGQRFDATSPFPFFLRNILGIEGHDGLYKFRVPIELHQDGSIAFATEIPLGATVRIMSTTEAQATEGASIALEQARAQIGMTRPATAIFFDCLASGLRRDMGFGYDLRFIGEQLEPAEYAGFSTCGQIVRADGALSGIQNCTSVVCVIPE